MRTQAWDLFEGLAEGEVSKILSLGSSRALPSGTILFRIGDEATDLFLVTAGAVKLTLPIVVGGVASHAMVEERLPGQLLGWSALVPPHKYTLQASAAADSDLLSLPRVDFLRLLTEMPAAGFTVFQNLAQILGERLQVSQTMWIREMQRVLAARSA